MRKMLAAAAMSLMFATGAAFAQATAVGDPAALTTAFYTDAQMTQLKSAEELQSVWSTLTPENKAALKQWCVTPPDAKASAFCTATGSFN